jgi:hypothetical protein
MLWVEWTKIDSRRKEGIFFCLLHSVQTDSGTHPAYYSKDTAEGGGLSSGVMRSGRKAHHETLSSSEVKNGEAILSFPISFYGIVFN